ncbi:MAG: hypothetical protein WAM27_06525 [Nitrososphaeraceae archaeon]
MFVHICGHIFKEQKNSLLLFTSLIAIIALTTTLANYLIPAYAHITKQFGNISLGVGWTEEPPLVGQLNSAIIVVEKVVTGGNSTPVSNALSQLDIKEKYGGITKPIEFVPSEQTEGGYEAKIIPTRIGSYSLLMNGSIQNQNITNVEIPLDEVEGTQMFSFPDREISGSSSGSISGNSNGSNQTITSGNNNEIGAKVEQILSQFSTDIDSIKGSIDKLNSDYANIQNSIQNAKSASDISFIIGMAGVGAGISGVIVSLIVLSRRGSVE